MTRQLRAVVTALRALGGRLELPPGVEVAVPTHAAVRYVDHARRGIAPLVDLYVPPAPEGGRTRTSVLLVHGGGFVLGSRRMKPIRYLASRLVGEGFAVCAVDYRMVLRGGRVEEAVSDVLGALEFWRARCSAFGLDPDAVAMVGLSAGATLAMLAAGQGAAVASVTSCFALYDASQLRGVAALLPRLLFRSRDRGAWRTRSPRGAPQPVVPTLLLHGTADRLVPVAHAHELAAHRASLGLPTKLVTLPDAPHGFFNTGGEAAELGYRELVAHVRATARITS